MPETVVVTLALEHWTCWQATPSHFALSPSLPGSPEDPAPGPFSSSNSLLPASEPQAVIDRATTTSALVATRSPCFKPFRTFPPTTSERWRYARVIAFGLD